MRRSTSFRDQGGIDTTTPPPPSPPNLLILAGFGPPPKGLIYQAKRHRTHPNTYFALKQRNSSWKNPAFVKRVEVQLACKRSLNLTSYNGPWVSPTSNSFQHLLQRRRNFNLSSARVPSVAPPTKYDLVQQP